MLDRDVTREADRKNRYGVKTQWIWGKIRQRTDRNYEIYRYIPQRKQKGGEFMNIVTVAIANTHPLLVLETLQQFLGSGSRCHCSVAVRMICRAATVSAATATVYRLHQMAGRPTAPPPGAARFSSTAAALSGSLQSGRQVSPGPSRPSRHEEGRPRPDGTTTAGHDRGPREAAGRSALDLPPVPPPAQSCRSYGGQVTP